MFLEFRDRLDPFGGLKSEMRTRPVLYVSYALLSVSSQFLPFYLKFHWTHFNSRSNVCLDCILREAFHIYPCQSSILSDQEEGLAFIIKSTNLVYLLQQGSVKSKSQCTEIITEK